MNAKKSAAAQSAPPQVEQPLMEQPAHGDKRSARERLLAAAAELFYEEGVNTVGIDRVIERAGVAKASLYSVFGSKEELIRAYLAERHTLRQQRVAAKIAQHYKPRDKLLAIFDYLQELVIESNFRGCAFVRASSESRTGDAAKAVSDGSRAWMRGLFQSLAREAGVKHPEKLARQLVLIYDGAVISAQMDQDAGAPATARAMAAALLDAAGAR
jgi:AcrR family transcriptional regulator